MVVRLRMPDATATGSAAEAWKVWLAGEVDLDAIAAIESASFGDPWPRDAFLPYVDRDLALFLVAERGSNVIGYLVAFLVADEAELSNIAVAEYARGVGVGAALLDALIRLAIERKILSVYLEVRESNMPARSLYTSRGFQNVGVRRSYYRNPVEDAIVLRKALT